uniref:Uncharacterized protein n=1 Tax=Anguilla anguilla TaxID=7936 RepID=A0A0E9XDP3_ANGAN
MSFSRTGVGNSSSGGAVCLQVFLFPPVTLAK